MGKRVVFAVGKQKELIKYLKKTSNLPWKTLAQKLSIRESTLSHAYLFEMCSLPREYFTSMANFLGEKEESLLKKYDATIRDEIIIIGRKALGEQRKKLEEINILFETSNLKLDNSGVNFSLIDKKKEIVLPTKITPELAEEIGMHYGDGFLSSKRFTYRLKGNLKDEIPYYQNYIAPLFKKLYNANVNLKQYQTTYGFELYSQAVCEFKIKTLKIKPGKKQDIEFPAFLRVNDIKILTSFIRGLFDTDGALYFKTNYGYKKYYPSISLALYSKKVIEAVGEILTMLGFKPKIYYYRGNQGLICLNGIASFKRYEKLIGWSSPKNLNKVKEWKIQYPELNKENMANVF
jgi:hypothetical protein